MTTILQAFATPATLDDALAGFVAGKLAQAIAERGCASLVVSGGSTPKGFFEQLSRKKMPWSQVSITLADERWLPPEHGDSNAFSVQRHLLQHAAGAAHFLPLYNGAATAELAVDAVAASLGALARPFDVVILGMGTDGHTASLFPGATIGFEGGDCVAVPPPQVTNVPVTRISLTATTLTDCRNLVLHITGQAKRDVLRKARRPGPMTDLPIRLALQQDRLPCQVYWAP